MLKFIAVLFVLSSTVSMAETLPVDEVVAGLRERASHLENLKKLFQTSKCAVTVGNNTVALSAGAIRENGIVMAITDTIKGNYLAFSKAPKAHMLKNVVQFTVKKAVNRVFIVSSSFTAAPGATEYTHLAVKVAEPRLQKDILDPATLKPTMAYEQYPIRIALESVKKGVTTKEITLKDGGSFSVSCQ